MRGFSIAAVLTLGCGGIFEHNPEFVGDSDGASGSGTSADESTATSLATGTGDSSACSPDGFEDNEDEASAAMLNNAMSDGPIRTEDAVLEGSDALDWYVFVGGEAMGAPPAVSAGATATDGSDLWVCAYPDCKDGTTKVMCSDEPNMSPDGRSGCCSSNFVSFTHECEGGANLDSFVYIKIAEKVLNSQCVDYELSWAFHA